MQSIKDFFNIVYSLPFIFQLVFMSFSVILVFTNVEKNFKSIGFFALKILACFAIHTIFSFAFFMLANYWSAIMIYSFFISYLLSLVLCCLLFSKLDIKSDIILAATLFGMEITVSQLEHTLMASVVQSWPEYVRDICSIILFSLIGIFAMIVKKHSISKISNISNNSMLLVLIVNSIFVILVCVYIGIIQYKYEDSDSGNAYFVATLFGFYIIQIAVYFLVYHDLKQNEDNSNLRVEKRMLEANGQAMILTEQSSKEIHDIRHDIKNQYMVMQMMLSEKKYDELNTYLRKSGADIANIPLAANYGNKDLNTIINIEMLKAHSAGVSLSVIAKVPDVLPFELSDMCSLFCNLIDNAIEAAKSADLNIPVTCFFNVKNDYFYVCIKNSVSKDISSEQIMSFKTKKGDLNSHGLGHKIVEKTAKKYNGYVTYEFKDGLFIAEVFLEMKKKGS